MQSLKLDRIEPLGQAGYRKIADGLEMILPVSEINQRVMIAADEAEDVFRFDYAQPQSLFDSQSPQVSSIIFARGQSRFERAQSLFVSRAVERAVKGFAQPLRRERLQQIIAGALFKRLDGELIVSGLEDDVKWALVELL